MIQLSPETHQWLPNAPTSISCSKPLAVNGIGDHHFHEQSQYALENSLSMKNMEIYKEFKNAPKRTSQERLFLLNALSTLSESSTKSLLSTMPSKENRPIFEITERQGLPRKLVQTHVRGYALRMLPKVVAEFDSARMSAVDAETRLNEIRNTHRSPKSAEIEIGEKTSRHLTSMMKVLHQCKLTMMNLTTTLAAYHFIEHATVYGNQLSFPLEHTTFDLITKINSDVKTKIDASREISDKISRILFGDVRLVNNPPIFPFTLTLKDSTKVPFLLVNVEHLPMDGPKFYFSEYFLTRKDKIVYVFPDQRKASRGKTVTTVLVELGSTDIPPKQLIQGRYTNNRQYDFYNSPEKLEMMKLRRLERLHNNAPENQRNTKALLLIQSALNKAKHHINSQKKEIAKLTQIPPLTYIYDPYNMRIDILFPQGQCTICHTTAHSFYECENRGCGLCFDRRHVSRRCRFKCDCRMGEIHAKEECTFGKSKGIHRDCLLEARMRNHPRRQDYIN